jgi:hypothetical protein
MMRSVIVKRMQETQQTLCFCYGEDGAKHYWLHPSGKRVTPNAAWRAVDSGELEPNNDCLLPDVTQTWRLKQYEPFPGASALGLSVDKRV